jgi:hypothetical protein
MFARLIFSFVNFAARNGLAESSTESSSAKAKARTTGVRGETFAYWYLAATATLSSRATTQCQALEVKSISSATTAAPSPSSK